MNLYFDMLYFDNMSKSKDDWAIAVAMANDKNSHHTSRVSESRSRSKSVHKSKKSDKKKNESTYSKRKACITAGIDTITNVGDAIKNKESAESIALTSLQTVSTLASSIGGPVGVVIGAITGVIGSIFGLCIGDNGETLEDTLDRVLKRQLSGLKRDLCDYMDTKFNVIEEMLETVIIELSTIKEGLSEIKEMLNEVLDHVNSQKYRMNELENINAQSKRIMSEVKSTFAWHDTKQSFKADYRKLRDAVSDNNTTYETQIDLVFSTDTVAECFTKLLNRNNDDKSDYRSFLSAACYISNVLTARTNLLFNLVIRSMILYPKSKDAIKNYVTRYIEQMNTYTNLMYNNGLKWVIRLDSKCLRKSHKALCVIEKYKNGLSSQRVTQYESLQIFCDKLTHPSIKEDHISDEVRTVISHMLQVSRGESIGESWAFKKYYTMSEFWIRFALSNGIDQNQCNCGCIEACGFRNETHQQTVQDTLNEYRRLTSENKGQQAYDYMMQRANDGKGCCIM
jgi:hypothetical protein